MENLEIMGVRTPDDIKNVYLKAVEENIKFYRAVSNSGKFYGWETSLAYPQGHHIPAQVGQEWFINDKYVEPVEEVVEETIETVEEPIEEVAENEPIFEPEVEPIVEENVEETVEEPTEEPVAEVENPTEISYQALYEDAMKQVGAFGEVIAEKDLLIQKLQSDNEQLATELAEYKTTIEKFVALFRG